MKPSSASISFFAGIIALAAALTKFWYLSPDAFPDIFKSAGNAFINALGIESSEVAADFELLFVLLVSFLLAIGLVGGARMLWRRIGARR